MPAERVSLTQQDTIEQYVRDLGGGFLFAGGENGYGLGGWYHTTIERILPVRMDAEKRRDEPEVAMALVIDRSGSMTGLPLEMAKPAAKATADTLAADDLLEVIAFDSQPTRIVQMTPAKHRARIQSDIARIQAGGGTEIFSRARRRLPGRCRSRGRKQEARHPAHRRPGAAERHPRPRAGDGRRGDHGDHRRPRRRRRREPAPDDLATSAAAASTRSSIRSRLPRIFTRETEMVSRSAAVEEYFQPRVVAPADFLRGIDVAGAPFLHGYVATKMKPPPAQEILESELGEPILARWHVGLGWTLAWTSDVKNHWAVEWLRWPQWGQFWGAARARAHAPEEAPGVRHARGDRCGDGPRARGDRRDRRRRRFQNGLEATLAVTGPEGSGSPAGSAPRKVPMPQTAPGRYEPTSRSTATARSCFTRRSRSRSTTARGARVYGPKTAVVAESFGHVTNPYPREYLALAPDVATLTRAAVVTGGGVDPAPAAVFDPAGEAIRYHEDLWPRFVAGAIVALLARSAASGACASSTASERQGRRRGERARVERA